MNRVNRLVGGERTVVFDTFASADGSDVTGRPTDSGFAWFHHVAGSGATDDPTIDGGKAHNRNDASIRLLLARRRVTKQTGAARCEVVVKSDNNASAIGPCVGIPRRLLGGTAGRYNTSGDVWQTVEPNLGTATSGGSAATIDQTYVVEVHQRKGSRLLFVDGVLMVKADGATYRRGFPGFRANGAATSAIGAQIDNWMVTR